MKIIFNELGAVIETITNDEPLRQGNVGNTITATFQGKNNLEYLATLNFKRADGETIVNTPMVESDEIATDYTYTFGSDFFFAVAGATEVNVFLHDAFGNIIASGTINFSIERTTALPNKCITQDQYNDLLALIADKMPWVDSVKVLEKGEDLPIEGERNVLYFKPTDVKNVYERYVWNDIVKTYIPLGDTTIDLSQYQKVSEKGKANGYAPLDKDRLIPSQYIAGQRNYKVFPTFGDFPPVSQAVVDTIYIAKDTKKEYVIDDEKTEYIEITSTDLIAQNVKYDKVASGLKAVNVQTAIDELASKKVNTAPLQWTTLPVDATDKKSFYKEVNKVLKTANNKIYMWEEPDKTPIKEFFDIWGKPTDFKATHVYITISSVSNVSSRDSFIMIIHSSNYANMYCYLVNGYAGQLVGNGSGWVSANLLSAERQKLLLQVGFYDETATVGFTNGVLDPNKDKPINGEFITRTTANGQGVYKGQTKVQVIGGNTIVANQSFNSDTKETETFGTITITKLGFNKWKVSKGIYNGKIDKQICKSYIFNQKYAKDHKILITGLPLTNSKYGKNVRFSCSGYGIFTEYGEGTIRLVKGTEGYIVASLVIQPNTEITEDFIVEPRCVDITQMFGLSTITNVSLDSEYVKIAKQYYANKPDVDLGTIINSQPTLLTSKTEQGEFIDELHVDSAKYFPDGMNCVNNIRDTLERLEIGKPKWRAVKRFSVVDLGTLDWSMIKPNVFNGTGLIKPAKRPQNQSIVANVICDRYTTENVQNIVHQTADKIIGVQASGAIMINDLSISDSDIVDSKIAKLNGVMLVYEIKDYETTLIDEPLDGAYNVENQGIETWDTEVPTYLSAIYLKDLVFDLAEQPKKNKEFDTRITALENDIAHYSKDIVDLTLDKADKTQLSAYMTKHKFVGDIYEIALYNQIVNTPNVMDGALFSIETENDTPKSAQNKGFPFIEGGSIIYGYFFNGQLDSPMILITPVGLFKVIDGGSLTCERIGTDEVDIEYLTPSQSQYNLSTLLFDYLKGVRVWYEYDYQGNRIMQSQDLRFSKKATTNFIVGNPLNIVGFFADTIAIQINTANGELKLISTGLLPQTMKLVDVKGLI